MLLRPTTQADLPLMATFDLSSSSMQPCKHLTQELEHASFNIANAAPWKVGQQVWRTLLDMQTGTVRDTTA